MIFILMASCPQFLFSPYRHNVTQLKDCVSRLPLKTNPRHSMSSKSPSIMHLRKQIVLNINCYAINLTELIAQVIF